MYLHIQIKKYFFFKKKVKKFMTMNLCKVNYIKKTAYQKIFKDISIQKFSFFLKINKILK